MCFRPEPIPIFHNISQIFIILKAHVHSTRRSLILFHLMFLFFYTFFSSSSLLSSFTVWWLTSTFNMHIICLYVKELEPINIKISDIILFVRLRRQYTCPSVRKCKFISFKYWMSIYIFLSMTNTLQDDSSFFHVILLIKKHLIVVWYLSSSFHT